MRVRGGGAAIGLLVLAGFALGAARAEQEKRPFTVRDAIEATRPIYPSVNEDSARLRAPSVSPDGNQFFVVTERGILDTNENEFALQLFEVSGHRRAEVRASQIAVMRSRTNWPSIFEPQWVDNDRIVFRGAEGVSAPQIYMADVRGQLRKRTVDASGVSQFAANARGDVIYLTLPVPDAEAIKDAMGGGYVAGRHLTALDINSQLWMQRVVPQRAELMHLAADAHVSARLATLDITPEYTRIVRLWMSPSGTQAVVLMPTTQYSEQWRGYDRVELREYVEQAKESESGTMVAAVFPFPQYFFVDLVSGVMRPLVIAPAGLLWDFAGAQPDATWSPDGRSILLVNCMYPLAQLDQLAPRDRARALKYPAILEVDPEAGQVRVVSFIENGRWELSKPVWSGDGRSIRIDVTDADSGNASSLAFARRGSTWRQRTHRGTAATTAMSERPGFSSLREGQFQAGIEQDINRPPRIAVFERGTNEPVYLSPLNPQLDGIDLSPMQTVTWTDENGDTWSGGLVYPARYERGRRYPLVIQTHGYNPNEFLFDSMTFAGDRPGAFSGMSARALAARGFFVLQEYGENAHSSARYDTPDEAHQFVRSYRAAIHQLAGLGFIDPDKVGIIGFSRTCYHVKYVLAHADYRIAAAAITDGMDYGYFQMMLADHAFQGQKVYGTVPVGAGLQAWLKEAPTFNADRFRTPLRIEAIDISRIDAEYEMYAALRIVGVPTELTVYPDGVHRLMKPLERYRSQQTNIDWLAYWINDEEDPDETKRAQYARWRALRAQWSSKP